MEKPNIPHTRTLNTPASRTHETRKRSKRMPNVRRSLTITEENDLKVQNRRGTFLALKPTAVDMDYTTMVNLLIELGDKVFSSTIGTDQVILNQYDIIIILQKYIRYLNTTLKTEALVDQLQDAIWNRLAGEKG